MSLLQEIYSRIGHQKFDKYSASLHNAYRVDLSGYIGPGEGFHSRSDCFDVQGPDVVNLVLTALIITFCKT